MIVILFRYVLKIFVILARVKDRAIKVLTQGHINVIEYFCFILSINFYKSLFYIVKIYLSFFSLFLSLLSLSLSLSLSISYIYLRKSKNNLVQRTFKKSVINAHITIHICGSVQIGLSIIYLSNWKLCESDFRSIAHYMWQQLTYLSENVARTQLWINATWTGPGYAGRRQQEKREWASDWRIRVVTHEYTRSDLCQRIY